MTALILMQFALLTKLGKKTWQTSLRNTRHFSDIIVGFFLG